MEGHHSGSNSQKAQDAYDRLTPTLRQKLIKKITETSIGDLVESKFVIYGPAFTMDGYEASYGSGLHNKGSVLAHKKFTPTCWMRFMLVRALASRGVPWVS